MKSVWFLGSLSRERPWLWTWITVPPDMNFLHLQKKSQGHQQISKGVSALLALSRLRNLNKNCSQIEVYHRTVQLNWFFSVYIKLMWSQNDWNFFAYSKSKTKIICLPIMVITTLLQIDGELLIQWTTDY